MPTKAVDPLNVNTKSKPAKATKAVRNAKPPRTMPPYRVAPSAIHGLGLFATRRIKAGQLIGRLEGVPTTRDGSHVLWVSETEGLRVTNELKYINHADDANAAYYDDLEVCAITDIEPGEEITHDYTGESG